MTENEPVEDRPIPEITEQAGPKPKALVTLAAKGSEPVDSGHLVAFLKERKVKVNKSGVFARSDGSVEVDSADPGLLAAWKDYQPPPPPEAPAIPQAAAEALQTALDGAKTLAEVKAFVRDQLIPALVRG